MEVYDRVGEPRGASRGEGEGADEERSFRREDLDLIRVGKENVPVNLHQRKPI